MSTETRVNIEESNGIGLVVGFPYSRDFSLDLLYSHQSTSLSAGNPDTEAQLFDLAVDYIHLGGSRFWQKGKLEPFFGAWFGVTHFNPDSEDFSGKTRFSLSLGGGTNLHHSKRWARIERIFHLSKKFFAKVATAR